VGQKIKSGCALRSLVVMGHFFFLTIGCGALDCGVMVWGTVACGRFAFASLVALGPRGRVEWRCGACSNLNLSPAGVG
jgi:hypothetical protein